MAVHGQIAALFDRHQVAGNQAERRVLVFDGRRLLLAGDDHLAIGLHLKGRLAHDRAHQQVAIEELSPQKLSRKRCRVLKFHVASPIQPDAFAVDAHVVVGLDAYIAARGRDPHVVSGQSGSASSGGVKVPLRVLLEVSAAADLHLRAAMQAEPLRFDA
jgi:hypothetical protein